MLVVKQVNEILAKDISDGEEVVGIMKQVLIGPADLAPTFSIRRFSIAPGGHTAHHSHPYEHGVVVLAGVGEVLTENGVHGLREGSVVFVPPHEKHQFHNPGPNHFTFLCVVPADVEK